MQNDGLLFIRKWVWSFYPSCPSGFNQGLQFTCGNTVWSSYKQQCTLLCLLKQSCERTARVLPYDLYYACIMLYNFCFPVFRLHVVLAVTGTKWGRYFFLNFFSIFRWLFFYYFAFRQQKSHKLKMHGTSQLVICVVVLYTTSRREVRNIRIRILACSLILVRCKQLITWWRKGNLSWKCSVLAY